MFDLVLMIAASFVAYTFVWAMLDAQTPIDNVNEPGLYAKLKNQGEEK